MAEHTREPWQAGPYTPDQIPAFTIYDTSGATWRQSMLVGYLAHGRVPGQAEANTRRIIACVNACAGLSTEELEGVSIAGRLAELGQTLLNTVDQRGAATAQRDEILGALETLENATRGVDDMHGCIEIAIARDVLKKYRRFK